ncbi:MAG: ADP-ribosylglycohydrolase family protein [Aggregatilineales bacterium]
MSLPPDYLERVYAGLLGKLIGVYMGRPIEGWTYERISAEIGEVWGYVHDRFGVPLIVTDDDISGTLAFLRALPEHGPDHAPAPAQIGQTWLNNIVEGKTILWWGGLGVSTEHTAYLRLKEGISAPESGSIARNGRVIAQQIGAQIFIDGWAMVAPGDPERAADLARRAASVSHDGEAIYGAQVIAAMEALAFVEPRLERLHDEALRFIPANSIIARLIHDLRAQRAASEDWRAARALLAQRYGYDRYGGVCHIVPNHGVIHLSLLYGLDDFRRALMIANTCGWDTDCNAGNVGCLLGIRGGLTAIDPDLCAPLADQLYLPTADGSRAITDAAREAVWIANLGRALAGAPLQLPKDGARFHFALPGSLHGFRSLTAQLDNPDGTLRVRFRSEAWVETPTFIPPEAVAMEGYPLLASPTLYPGQRVQAALRVPADSAAAVAIQLAVAVYGAGDMIERLDGPAVALSPGEARMLEWRIPETDGAPICAVGLVMRAAVPQIEAIALLDWLTWSGVPELILKRPAGGGTLWRRVWVDGVDSMPDFGVYTAQIVQNEGIGLAIYGDSTWDDYEIELMAHPGLCEAAGIAVRVGGMRRWYALMFETGGRVQWVKRLDDAITVLGEAAFDWQIDGAYQLRLRVEGARLSAWLAGEALFALEDGDRPLLSGAIGLICRRGTLATGAIALRPAAHSSIP